MTMEEKDTEDWGTPIYYTQHPSLRKLTPLEKQFLLAVEHGDAPMVKKMVALTQNSHPSVDINCMDSVGRSATLMAIDNENLDILVLLLESGAESRDALLHAINAEYVEAVDLLLEHEEIIYKEGDPHSWERVDRDISTFAPEITPLILAAHKNNYEILKLLLDRGATLPMPHDVRCCCNECVTSNEQDCLCHSRSRINAYRALSSPSLICLSSIDPILTAFELSWELRRLSNIENEFKDDYQKLRSRCQDFATSLLDHARSSHELEIVLNYDPTRPPYQQGEHMPLSRVQMAIKYKQKKFIAHPNVQQLMSTLWYDGLPGFRRQHPVHQLWNIIKIGVLFPFYSAMYMLLPHSGHGKLIKKPFFKFILHSFSYLFFLFLLILASQRVETLVVQWFGTEKMKMELAESMKMQRGQLPTIIETSIFLYIIAHIWQETRELWTKGLVAYFQNMWNIIDFTRNSLYVATVGLRTLAYFQARSEILANPMSAYIPREDWDAFDPTLIADGLFAAGNIFAALKLVHIFSINPYLGPLQISLGRMVIDIIKFFFIYTLVLFAFACGLNQLLWYYADMEKQQCYSGPGGTENWVTHRDSCLAWRRFSNLFESSQSLFWASFGLVDISNFELTGIKSYTRFWGLLMFGSYSVINVVVLLNLLIAMMSNSYNIISERADVEWKFARTTLFMNYFDEGGTVPPPFNLFPKVKNIIRLLGKKKSVKDWSITRKEKTMKERDTIYQNVMCNLVWRYVTAQQKVVDSLPVTEDNINEVRQDVAAFRHDLMHVLRANGVNTKDVEVEKLQDVAGKRIQINKRRLMKDFSIGLMEVFTEDAAPEVRENKSVLARLVGLSATESRSSQRWRDLIQLAKKSKIIGNRDSTRFGSLRQSSLRSDDEPEECNNTQVSQQPEKEESLQQSSILNAPRNTMVSKKLLSPIPSPRSLIKESDAHQVRNNSPRKLAPPIPVSTQPQSQESININNLVQTSPSMDSTNKTQSAMDKMLFINKISEELVLKPLNHESTIDANQKIKYDKQVIQKTLQHSKNEKKNEDIFENGADVPTPPKPKAGRNVAMLPLDAKIESKIEEESGRKVESPLNKKNNTSINSEDEVQQITEKTKSVANIPILKRDTTIIVPSTPECSPKKATMPPDTIITTDMMHQRSKADTTVSTKYNSAGNLKVKEEAKSVLISVTDFLEEKSSCMNKKEMGPKSLNESEEDKARLAILERQMAPCTTEIELNPSFSKESSAKKLMGGGGNAQSAVATVEGSVSKIPSTIKGCVKTLGSRKGWI